MKTLRTLGPRSDATNTVRVCGVDGCRSGWVVATPTRCFVVAELDQLIDGYDVIGIDMPIGMSQDGTRSCDSAARKAIFGRSSTVFPVPARSIVGITDYATANAESRLRFGRGVSRQSFAIWSKIREVDSLAQHHRSKFVEIHPECSFTRMTGQVPPSKHIDVGKYFRRKALDAEFEGVPSTLRGSKADDVLDAYAVLWSALRYAEGVHETLGDGALDACGLRMRIVV